MTSEQTTQWVARRVFTRGLLSVLALQLAFVPLAIAADGDDALVAEPTKIIDEAAQKIVAVLARTEEPAEVRIGEIEEIAYEIFDFTTMSKLVLARNWRKLDKEKRAEFVREFRTHLSRTYGTRLDNFSDIGVDVYGAQVEVRNDVTVKSRVVGGQFDGSELAYRMRNRKEGWKIIDVVMRACPSSRTTALSSRRS